MVFACFAAHAIEVWLFAAAICVFTNRLGLGAFGGQHQGNIIDYVYFSVVTYNSLGFGDISPIDNVRLIAGI
ncbi:MAG: ion channel [Dongiaceae bacterium]